MKCPKELESINQVFKDYANDFYKVLSEGKVFTRGISVEEYNNLINQIIREKSDRVHFDHKLFEINMLLLPFDIVLKLHDYLNTADWDYEFGIGVLLDSLSGMFDKSPVKCEWGYDNETGKITYSLDETVWERQIESLDAEDFETYDSIFQNMKQYLQKKGLTLIAVVTGDQTSTTMLIPLAAVPEVTKFLVTEDDSKRAEKIYRLLDRGE